LVLLSFWLRNAVPKVAAHNLKVVVKPVKDVLSRTVVEVTIVEVTNKSTNKELMANRQNVATDVVTMLDVEETARVIIPTKTNPMLNPALHLQSKRYPSTSFCK
jgi:hypothetical protein